VLEAPKGNFFLFLRMFLSFLFFFFFFNELLCNIFIGLWYFGGRLISSKSCTGT